MAYQALYRQWRPQTFSAMVGQEAVIATLRNQIMTGRIAMRICFAVPGERGKPPRPRLWPGPSTALLLCRVIHAASVRAACA